MSTGDDCRMSGSPAGWIHATRSGQRAMCLECGMCVAVRSDGKLARHRP